MTTTPALVSKEEHARSPSCHLATQMTLALPHTRMSPLKRPMALVPPDALGISATRRDAAVVGKSPIACSGKSRSTTPPKHVFDKKAKSRGCTRSPTDVLNKKGGLAVRLEVPYKQATPHGPAPLGKRRVGEACSAGHRFAEGTPAIALS